MVLFVKLKLLNKMFGGETKFRIYLYYKLRSDKTSRLISLGLLIREGFLHHRRIGSYEEKLLHKSRLSIIFPGSSMVERSSKPVRDPGSIPAG